MRSDLGELGECRTAESPVRAPPARPDWPLRRHGVGPEAASPFRDQALQAQRSDPVTGLPRLPERGFAQGLGAERVTSYFFGLGAGGGKRSPEGRMHLRVQVRQAPANPQQGGGELSFAEPCPRGQDGDAPPHSFPSRTRSSPGTTGDPSQLARMFPGPFS